MDPDVKDVIGGVETAFGVKFQDAEITNESTIDDLYNVLALRFGAGTSDRCLTSVVFWRLRRALMQALDLPKSAIKPSMAIEVLIPPFHRRRTWFSLSKALGLSLPGLEYPSWCASVMFIISCAPLVLVMLWGGSRFSWLGWAAAILAIPLVATLLCHVAKPFATAVPKHSRTVGETARTVVGLNHAKLVQELGSSHPTELRKALRSVVTDMTGAEPYWLEGHTRLVDLVETTLLRGQV